MKKNAIIRTGAVTVLGAGLLLAPAVAASAAPLASSPASHGPFVTQSTDDASCTVTGGNLTWGLKESFRSYIKSSIAKGDWETLDGAEYELPDFMWNDATGEFDAQTGAGSVNFTGSLHFTGHDGVLDMWIENPTVEFAEDGSAVVLVDARSNDVDGNPKVEVTQERFADLGAVDGINLTPGANSHFSLEDVPATLTAEGVPAFGDFYVEGDALDPIQLAFDVECESAVAEAPEEQPADEAEAQGEDDATAGEDVEQAPADETDESNVPWLPIGIGAAAVVVIGVAAALLATNRKKSASSDATDGDAPDGGSGS